MTPTARGQAMSNTTPRPLFVGWVRTAGREWARACSAHTLASCWDALLVVAVAGRDAERVVLPEGTPPRSYRKGSPG